MSEIDNEKLAVAGDRMFQRASDELKEEAMGDQQLYCGDCGKKFDMKHPAIPYPGCGCHPLVRTTTPPALAHPRDMTRQETAEELLRLRGITGRLHTDSDGKPVAPEDVVFVVAVGQDEEIWEEISGHRRKAVVFKAKWLSLNESIDEKAWAYTGPFEDDRFRFKCDSEDWDYVEIVSEHVDPDLAAAAAAKYNCELKKMMEAEKAGAAS